MKATHFIDRLRIGAAVFAYVSMGLVPATVLADDIDVYTKAVAAGGGGASVIIFNADTSASMGYSYKVKEANAKQDMIPSADAGAMPTSLLDQRWYMLGDAMRTQVTSLGGAFKVGIVGDDGDAGANPGNSGRVYQKADPLSSGTTPPVAPPPLDSGTLDIPITDARDDAMQNHAAAPIDYGGWDLLFGYNWGSGGWGYLNIPFNAHWNSSGGMEAPYPSSWQWDWVNGTGAIFFEYYHSSTDDKQIFYLDSAADTVLYVIGQPYDVTTGLWGPWGNLTYGPMPSPNDDRAPAVVTCPADNYTKTTTNGANVTTSTTTITWTLNAAQTTCSHICQSTEVPKTTGNPKWSFNPASPCTVANATITKAPSTTPANTNSTVSVTGLQQGYWYYIIATTKTPGVNADFTINLEYPGKGRVWGYNGNVTPSSASSRVGLVFRNAQVPQGARIDRAWVQFTSDSWNDGEIKVRPRMDADLDSKDLLNGILFNRNWWVGDEQAMVPWTWGERDVGQRVDVQALVQQKVDTEGWCGQNMMFAFSDDLTVYDWNRMRLAFSYELANSGWYDTMNVPTLHIEWSRDGDTAETMTCSEPVVKTYSIGSNTEDVYQDGTNVWLDSKTLSVGTGKTTGLRFSLVDIPPGAQVRDAKLIFTAAANATPTEWRIDGIAQGLAKPFLTTSSFLDGIPAVDGLTVSWTPASWTQGNEYTVTGAALKALVQQMINHPGWEYDGTLGFLIRGVGPEQQMYAWEQTASGIDEVSRGQFGTKSARLVITLDGGTAFPGGTTHRRAMADWISAYSPTGHTAMAGSLATVADYIKGRLAGDGYPAPAMATGSCANNVNIVASDLMENPVSYFNAPSIDARVTSHTGSGCGNNASNAWPCFYDLLSAIYEPDKYGAAGLATDGNLYSMRTYTVGMGATAQTGGGNLRAGSNKGGGDYYSAANAGELIKLFNDIIRTVADSGATIATPGVAVNALNKFEHLDELYYSLFKPQVMSDWRGNLKRYRLKDHVIVDVTNTSAVLNTDSVFKDTSYSWWSTQLDGASVIGGGVADHFDTPDTRKLFTYIGSNGSSLDAPLYDSSPMDGTGSEAVTSLNTAFTPPQLGVPSGGAPAGWTLGWDEYAVMRNALDFLRGGTNALKVSSMGASIHGSPALISYGVDSSGHSINTVYVSDNFGILHMVNTGEPSSDLTNPNLANTGGRELFAFIPQELLPNAFEVSQFPQSVLGGDYVYGLDASWIPWKFDDTGGDIDPTKGDRVYLYGGMRRGGKNIYALDVTSVRNDYAPDDIQPILKWVVQGGAAGPYANMGQTWSDPAPRWIKWNGQRRRVIFFGGGYDEAVHDTVQSFTNTTQLGSQLYMVDALTGDLLWKASSSAGDVGTNTVVPDMKYSITAAPITMDRNGNSFVDGLIIVDLAGQVFRFDFNESVTNASEFVRHGNAAVVIGKFGSTAPGANTTTDNRRFFDYPAVGYVPGRNNVGADLIIALTSGYRESPYNNDTTEKLIVFRDVGAWNIDAPVNASVTLADLDQVTLTNTGDLADTTKVGWYGDFGTTAGTIGERGVGSPLLYNYVLVFSTFMPVSGGVSSACTPDVGFSNLWAMNILTGEGTMPNGERVLDNVTPGIGSTAQLIYTQGELSLLENTTALDAANVGISSGDLGKVRRSRWFEMNE